MFKIKPVTIDGRKRRLRVLIPDGNSIFVLPVCRCLRAAGVDVFLMIERSSSPVRWTRHKKGVIYTRPDSSYEERVNEAITAVSPDVLMPISFAGILELSEHRKAFSSRVTITPLADPETLKRAGDKGCLAVFAAAEGIPIPKTLVYDPATGLNGPLESLRFPVLVKPVDGTAGQGIEKLETPSDFALFAGRTKTGRRWVLQEIVGGADVDCSVLCHQGRIVAWTIQRGLLSRTKAYMPPSAINFTDDEPVLAVITKTMKALEFEGVANCDLRCDAATGDVRLIEINPRFWGSLYASHVAGVNFPALALSQALGLRQCCLTLSH